MNGLFNFAFIGTQEVKQKNKAMNVLVFKTDIQSDEVNDLKSILDIHPSVKVWSVDTQDIDKVLRVEAANGLSEMEVINLVRPQGFYCEVLRD